MNMYSQAELNREASNTYTFRLGPRTPRIEKTHPFLQYSVSSRYITGSACWGASNGREPNNAPLLFSSSSLQSSSNQTWSPITVTPSRSIFSLLIDWTIKGTIISRRNTAASISRFSSVKMSSEYYAFTIRVDQVNLLREKFGVSA